MFPYTATAGTPDTLPLGLQAFALQPGIPSLHVHEGVSRWEIYFTACGTSWCHFCDDFRVKVEVTKARVRSQLHGGYGIALPTQEVHFAFKLTPTFKLSASKMHYWRFGFRAIVFFNEKILVSLA